MAVIEERLNLPHDDLLEGYVEALRRRGGTGAPAERMDVPPGHDIRTCTHCGALATFTVDFAGVWARCDACGRDA